MKRTLVGLHHHRHGDSIYLFHVPTGKEFGLTEFAAYLAEAYEEDREEYLELVPIPPDEIVEIA